MSDRARSSVRTETRDGSGTSDEVSEAAGPVDDARDRPDAGTGVAAPHSAGATAVGPRGTTAPRPGFSDRPDATVKQSVPKATEAEQGEAKPAAAKAPAKAAPARAAVPDAPKGTPAKAEPAARTTTPEDAPPAAPAPPAAHPVTPLRPTPPATGTNRVARTAAPLPVDATQAVTLPPAGARPVDPASRPATTRSADAGARPAAETAGRTGKARGVGRGPRRARLQLRHIDTWSALKISLVVSIALFFVWMIAVAVLYGVLGSLGVFDTLNDLIGQLSSSSGDAANDGGSVISAKVVLGGAAVIGAINIVLLTALCTVAAFVYNLCSDLVGGLEVTLAERD